MNSPLPLHLSGHQILPAITVPTRGHACLDNIFVKGATVAGGLVCQTSITDHNICLLRISLTENKQQHTPTRTIFKTNLKAVISKLLNVDWSNVTDCVLVNESVRHFSGVLRNAVKINNR